MLTPKRKTAPSAATTPCFVVLDPITPKIEQDFSEELKKVINERNMLTSKTRRRVTEALEEIQCENDEDRRRNKRAKILNEIIKSEENYIKQLETVMTYFVRPVRDRRLLKQQEFDTLFGNIGTIHMINKELLMQLKAKPEEFAQAFVKIAPFFKSYSFYAFEFKKSLEILQNCHKENPAFAKFLEMQESRPEVQSKLSALLIAPIQRVPRYKLLLKPLFELATPEDTGNDLQECLRKVEDAAEHINKIIQERENMQRLIELQRCLQTNDPNVVVPGRHFIKEGVLMEITKATTTAHTRKCYIVLTNDIILFAKVKSDNLKTNSLKCSAIYPLNKCRVMEVLDKGSFRLICQNDEIVLYHKSLSETMEWIQAIKNAIQTLLADRKTLRKESSERRPAVKRKDLLRDYHDVGLSPGQPLKKKRLSFIDQPIPVPETKRLILNRRKAIGCSRTPSSDWTSTSSPQPLQVNNNRELFVFGQTNQHAGFSFKMSKFLTGVGTSLKKFLWFKK